MNIYNRLCRTSWIVTWLCVTLAYLSVSVVRANENTVEYDSSVAGHLVPKEETDIEVLDEHLNIKFNRLKSDRKLMLSGHLGMPSAHPVRVEVTARYRLFNPHKESKKLKLAFPIFRCGPEEHYSAVRTRSARYINASLMPVYRRGVHCEVRFNNKSIPYEYISFESLFEKERSVWVKSIREWLGQWPEMVEFLDGKIPPLPEKSSWPEPKPGMLQAQPSNLWRMNTPNENGRCFADVLREIAPSQKSKSGHTELNENHSLWVLMAGQAICHVHIEDWDLDFLSFLHSKLHPEKPDSILEFLEMWQVENDWLNANTGELNPLNPLHSSGTIHWDYSKLNRRIDFLIYEPELKGMEESTIEVTYSHLVDAEIYPATNPGNPREIVWGAYLYHFQYILRTSANWEKFGPIHVRVDFGNARGINSISLPMDYVESSPSKQYTLDIPIGSAIRENLHIGLGGDRNWNPKGDPYPGNLHLRTFWDKYRNHPDGPMARKYLDRLEEKIRLGAIQSVMSNVHRDRYIEEYSFWCQALGVNPDRFIKEGLDTLQPTTTEYRKWSELRDDSRLKQLNEALADQLLLRGALNTLHQSHRDE